MYKDGEDSKGKEVGSYSVKGEQKRKKRNKTMTDIKNDSNKGFCLLTHQQNVIICANFIGCISYLPSVLAFSSPCSEPKYLIAHVFRFETFGY